MSEEIGRFCQLRGIREEKNLLFGMDFRLPQYRREVFLRFYEFHLKYRAHPGCVYYLLPYLRDRLDMDKEQQLWFAYINGCSQHPPTTYIIWKRFPYIQNVDIEELAVWWEDNRRRLGWDTDRRHHKYLFPICVKNYQCNLPTPCRSQEEFFEDLAPLGGDDFDNFHALWDKVRGDFFSFGRLSTFSYLEYLRILGIPLDCDDLLLEDKEGSRSHRNGLCKVLGRDDLDWHSSNPSFDGRYTKEQIAWLTEEAALLLKEAKARLWRRSFYYDVSYFTLESTLCCYKSWHRVNRRYPNVYSDMLHKRLKDTEEKWPEEDLSIFWDARRDALPQHLRLEDSPGDVGLKSEKQNHYRLTGQAIMMDEEWDCFRNDYNDKVSG